MKILLINRFFGNPQVPTGRMLADLAKELSDRGHKVSVIVSQDSYVGVSAGNAQAMDIGIYSIGLIGPKIARWPMFMLRAVWQALKMQWDCCVILTDPPFLTVLAGLESLLRGKKRKIYWWTMDLYPEALVAAGLIKKKSVAQRILFELNEWGLRTIKGVISLDRAQKKRLSGYRNWNRQMQSSIVIPPWDFRKLAPVPVTENKFICEYGLSGRKIAMYAGNLGRAHHFRQLLSAARFAGDQGDQWMFVFVCRGVGREQLELESMGMGNVIILDYVRPELTSHMLYSATVHLITMQDQWEGICVPSKLYGILSTGIPVLYIGPLQSGTAEEIMRYRAGMVLPTVTEGQEILSALNQLDELTGTEITFDTSGPSRIADFITHHELNVRI